MRELRGYFGIGAEAISKPMNFGALQRTAHAFGASFTFTGDANHNGSSDSETYSIDKAETTTSNTRHAGKV